MFIVNVFVGEKHELHESRMINVLGKSISTPSIVVHIADDNGLSVNDVNRSKKIKHTKCPDRQRSLDWGLFLVKHQISSHVFLLSSYNVERTPVPPLTGRNSPFPQSYNLNKYGTYVHIWELSNFFTPRLCVLLHRLSCHIVHYVRTITIISLFKRCDWHLTLTTNIFQLKLYDSDLSNGMLN